MIKIYGWLCWFACRFLYGPWSRLYRFLFESKYTEMPILLPWTPVEVLQFYKGCTWVEDSGDQISKPEKFFETRRGDCDEWAIFAATVLRQPTWILSVNWYNPKGKTIQEQFVGHNVCVYISLAGYFHIGNWGKYGAFDTTNDLIKSIVPEGCKYVNHAFRDPRSLKWLGKKI